MEAITRRLRLARARVRLWWHDRVLGHLTFVCTATGFGTVSVSCRTCRREWYRVPFAEVIARDLKRWREEEGL